MQDTITEFVKLNGKELLKDLIESENCANLSEYLQLQVMLENSLTNSNTIGSMGDLTSLES